MCASGTAYRSCMNMFVGKLWVVLNFMQIEKNLQIYTHNFNPIHVYVK